VSAEIPAFAIVGAVNHGKSSVVSALAENDAVRVSPVPGETIECQRFALRDLFVFYDTPGFQNAREALRELRGAPAHADPLEAFRDFVARHRGDPAFEAECRLFAPLLDGAGLIYVVDGSRPLLDIHLAEMELLRLTGAPRLAIINRTGADDHVAAWKRRLGQHFNAVREFDAHRASFADRIELLETLAGIEQHWKPRLAQAVTLLQTEWSERLDDAAAVIVDLLVECLGHRETAPAPDAAARSGAAESLRQRYREAIGVRETAAHGRLIALFSHRLVSPAAKSAPLFGDDLFSEATWRLFGLESGQLVGAGVAAGAVAGAAADAATLGHTLLAGTAIGAAIGGAAALALGRRRPELGIGVPGDRLPAPLRVLLPGRLRVAGEVLVVGPYAALNFPWILLDRALATLAYVTHRSHARRDRVALDASRTVAVLQREGLAVSRWSDADRKRCERLFAALRRPRSEVQASVDALQAIVRRHAAAIAAARPDFAGADGIDPEGRVPSSAAGSDAPPQ
jgi:hypothetical protein